MEPSPTLHFLGRLHPLVVHFPIALILVAGFLQLLRGRRAPSEAIGVCLAFGALGAVFAASFGWLYAENDPPGSAVADTLFWHRWLGVGTAVVGVLCAVLARLSREAASKAYLLTLLCSVGLVSYGAHLGGVLVYGETYLFEVFEERPTRSADPVRREPEAESMEVMPADLAEPADSTGPTGTIATELPIAAESPFERDVLPIFEHTCFECHGPTGRAKGGLRLNDEDALFEGGSDLWVVDPGKPESSFLIELVSLPADDEDRMPPEGELLTAEEIAKLRAWVAGLAPRDGAQ